MPSEVTWLPEAVKDVYRLREFIQNKNPAAAQRAAKRIRQAVAVLADNPEAGRPVDDLFPFRELLIPFGSGGYRLRYREEGRKVVIVRIHHSREDGVGGGSFFEHVCHAPASRYANLCGRVQTMF